MGTGFGIAGKWPGWFALAKDVALDSAGNVYVADAFNGRAQSFTPDGELLAIWDGAGSSREAEGAGGYASGLAVDARGHALDEAEPLDSVRLVRSTHRRETRFAGPSRPRRRSTGRLCSS